MIEGDSRVVDTDTGEIVEVEHQVFDPATAEPKPQRKPRQPAQAPPPIPEELPFDPEEEQQAELAAQTDYDSDEAPF